MDSEFLEERTNELVPAYHTGSLECPCVPSLRSNNRLRCRFWLEPDSIFGSLSMTVPGAVHFCWTFHSACPADHIDARSPGNLLAEVSSSRRWREVVSAASDPTVTSRTGADRLLRTEPQVRLTNLFSYRTITGTSSLFRTQALLLSSLRFLGPRSSRGEGAVPPRHVIDSWPQTRHFHELGLAQYRARTQTVCVHEQSTFVFRPRQQSRQQPVRIRELATASTIRKQAFIRNACYPQTIRSLEPSTSATSSLTEIVHELRQAGNDPRRSVALSVSPLTFFPVHIRSLCPRLIQPQFARRSNNSRLADHRSSRIYYRRRISSRNCDRGACRIAPSPTCSHNIVCQSARWPLPCFVIRCLVKPFGHASDLGGNDRLSTTPAPLLKPRARHELHPLH